MQMIGSVTFLAAGMAAVTGLSVSLYAVLPKSVLACAERHGRYQGLRTRETLPDGTPSEALPLGRQMAVAE
jgi:hypothetical protein